MREYEGILLRWLEWWHGKPDAEHQAHYYRCQGCQHVIAWHAIRQGGCPCKKNRLVPIQPTAWQELRWVLCPWWGVIR